jgi:hypothetical protein
VLVYFGYPQTHEDDAEQAVRAGLALVEAVTNLICRRAGRRSGSASQPGLPYLDGEVRNVPLLVAIGVNERGYREILGICEGAQDKTGWSEFLKQRIEGCPADHLGCLHWACRKVVSQYLQLSPDWQKPSG